MKTGSQEEIIEDFTIRLVNEKGKITDFNYTPSNIDEIWDNVNRYLSFCFDNGFKTSIETAMEYTDTPFWIFSDDRTKEIIKLYFAMKQNPMFLYGSIENTPTIWIDSTSLLNILWNNSL